VIFNWARNSASLRARCDVDRADHRPYAGLHVEHERRVPGAVRLVPCRHARLQVAVRPQRAFDDPRELLDSRHRRRRTRTLGHGLAELPFVDAGRLHAREPDVIHRPRADHVEPQADAAALPRRIHPHVLEPAHREQVQDRFADVAHGERLAGVDVDHARQRRLDRLQAVDDEMDRLHGWPR
jgi:hypothetical protein